MGLRGNLLPAVISRVIIQIQVNGLHFFTDYPGAYLDPGSIPMNHLGIPKPIPST